jgi:hypothetical protein
LSNKPILQKIRSPKQAKNQVQELWANNEKLWGDKLLNKIILLFCFLLFCSFTLAKTDFKIDCSPTVFQINPQADNLFKCFLQNNSDNNLSISLELVPNYLQDYITHEEIPPKLAGRQIWEVNFTIPKSLINQDILGFIKFSANDGNDTNTSSIKVYLLTKASYDSFFNTPDNTITQVEKPMFSDQLTWLGNFFENSHFDINGQPVKNWMLIVAGIIIIFSITGLCFLLKRS